MEPVVHISRDNAAADWATEIAMRDAEISTLRADREQLRKYDTRRALGNAQNLEKS